MTDTAVNPEPSEFRAQSSYDPLTATDPVAAALSHYQQAISLFDEDEIPPMAEEKPEEKPVPASFLDALVQEIEPSDSSDLAYISAVNSDDVGLYRMFRGYSP
ncbi:hypothetical protein M8R20_17000 [Pseudomonas sp. R2.Fl]|nr:hypothetical protein [Pseudomonas sp. R2.Fl]